MSLADTRKLEEAVVSLLKDYSGKKDIGLDQLIGREVGISGWDGVDILYQLEESFKVDLNPLMESSEDFLPPSCLDRLLGRKHGRPYADLTVRELINYIAASQTSSSKSN